MKNNLFTNAIENIDSIFDFTVTNAANDYFRVDIGVISESFALNINENTTFDLVNYTISIDTHGIRHILRQHGNQKTESDRGQFAVSKKNLKALIKIINAPDIISDAGKSAIGKDCILIQKEINEKEYFSIWEIRAITSIKKQNKKKNRIVLQTFYILNANKKPS